MQDILKEIADKIRNAGYTELTPIQRIAGPKILMGEDTLIVAPTGHGKTEAAVLPIFSLIYLRRPQRISGLYVTPLRALNRDLYSRLSKLGEVFQVKVAVRHGDSSAGERKRLISDPPDFLITTPETLGYLLVRKEVRQHLTNLRWVIVDELQEMLDEKRGYELSVVLERLRRISKNRIQVVGISATVGDLNLAKLFLNPRGQVQVAKVDTVKEMELKVLFPRLKEEDLKDFKSLNHSPAFLARLKALSDLIERNKPVIIFTNTRETAEFLASQLKLMNVEVDVHHGSLSKEVRMKVEKALKEGQIGAIISTSSLELGIDIGSINLVAQYMSPRQVSRLLQRVGRSGHSFKRKSKGIVIPAEDVFDTLESLVICDAASEGYLEKPLVEEKPLDVVAHQIAGMVLEGYSKPSEIYQVISSSYFFSNLSEEEFREVLELLRTERVVKFSGDQVSPSHRIWKYFYRVTMIPDTSSSLIAIDVSSRQKIGSLDRDFVVTLQEDDVIVLSGVLWKVVSIEKDHVFLERTEIKRGILPAWVGETIPVEKEIASRVHSLMIRALNGEESPLPDEVIEEIKKTAREMKKRNYPLPSLQDLLAEVENNEVIVIHSPLGSRGNNTLGSILAFSLQKLKGIRVTYREDPYHIALASPLPITVTDLKEIWRTLQGMDEEELRSTLREAIRNSPEFRWKLLVEAKRFGALDPEAEEIVSLNLVRTYSDTIIGEEALRELEVKNYDVDVLGLIKRMQIRAVEVPTLSPLARRFVEKLMSRDRKNEAPILVEVVKRRLNSKEMLFICLSCGWSKTLKVQDSPERCRNCGSVFLAVTSPEEQRSVEVVKMAINGVKLKGEDSRLLESLKVTSSIFSSYKKYAAIALAAQGVGPYNLGKVLSKLREGEVRFYESILEEEKRFIRTRKFWK